VFPETVEAVYGSSPLIREIAVLEQDGMLVGLVVPDLDEVRIRGAESVTQLIRDEIRDLSLSLPSYQRLSGHVLTRLPLPRTTIGKLRRHQIPDLYLKAGKRIRHSDTESGSEEKPELPPSAVPGIWEWLGRRFPDTELTLDTSPQLDLGVDSLGWMGLSLEIEDRFGLSLSDQQIARIMTLRDLVQELENAETTGSTRRNLSPEQARFLRPPNLFQKLAGSALYGLFWLGMRLFFRLQIVGQRNLPNVGPFIIAPNHASWLDPVVVAASLSYAQARQVRFAGWTGLMFDNVISRSFSWAARVFPVNPDRAAAASLVLARAVLDQGSILVWFPEGRRTQTGALQPFQPGIGALIQGNDIPVVPTYISGSYAAAPTGRIWPHLTKLKICFGAPQTAGNLAESVGEGATAQNISNALYEVVSNLQG
jgi:long-chain acyl-CoA synthetase